MGKRVCLGKTFAETEQRLVIPYLLANFDFELTEEFKLIDKPCNDIEMINIMKLNVKKINDIMEPVLESPSELNKIARKKSSKAVFKAQSHGVESSFPNIER